MEFTPKYGTKLDSAQADKLRQVRKNLATEAPQKIKQSFAVKAANSVSNFIGASGIVDQFSSSLARTGLRLSGNSEAANQVGNPSMKEVVGSAIQTGANFVPGGVGGSLAKKVSLGALMGQMSDTGSDLQADKSIKESLQPGAEAAISANIPFLGAGFRKFGSLMEKAGDKVQFSVIKPNASDVADGFSVENIRKYDLGGSLKQSFQKTEDKLRSLSQELNTKLQNATEQVDMNEVFQNTVKSLQSSKNSIFGSNARIGNTLDNLREEIITVAGDAGSVPVIDANEIKRAAGHFGAWQFGFKDPDANAQEKVYTEFYKQLKTAIEKASPEGVQEINKQMSDIIPVMNALIRRIPVAERNNAISLGDIFTLSASTANPSAGLLTLANMASKSGRVGNFLSKQGEKASKAESVLGSILTKIGIQSTNQQE